MTTDALQDYDELVESGFTEQQARALIRVIATDRTDPAVLNTLGLILQRLDEHSRILESLTHDVSEIKDENRAAHQERAEMRADLKVVHERVQMESRVSRMTNATLIALGAIAASMAAVFAR